MNENHTEYLLKGGRFYRRETHEYDIGTQEYILNQLTEGQKYMFKDFMAFNDSSLHLLVSKESLVLAAPLRQLPWKSKFTLDPGQPMTHLSPNWQPDTAGIIIDDPWKVPPDLTCLFCVYMIKTSTAAASTWIVSKCYLFVYWKKELYKLPYPNIYEDGRICMGDQWEAAKLHYKGSVMNKFLDSYNSFHSTVCSDHLTSTGTYKVFSRTLEKWDTNVPVNEYLSPVSNACMTGFTLE